MTANASQPTPPPHEEANPDLINITTAAIEKVYSLMEEEENLNLKLRIFITGGGCSGFQYGFSFEEEVGLDDFLIEKQLMVEKTGNIQKVIFLIDAMSMQYLKKAKVDYRKDPTGEQFIISNPNAKTTCGCGSSFSADTEEDANSGSN